MFEAGEPASPAIEGIAEDGAVGDLLAELADVSRVDQSGVAFGPGGPLFAGDSTTFTITASPGDRLFLASMFVQSNDFFFADDGLASETGDGFDLPADEAVVNVTIVPVG